MADAFLQAHGESRADDKGGAGGGDHGDEDNSLVDDGGVLLKAGLARGDGGDGDGSAEVFGDLGGDGVKIKLPGGVDVDERR